MKKRMFTLAMILILCLTLMPLSAFALEGPHGQSITAVFHVNEYGTGGELVITGENMLYDQPHTIGVYLTADGNMVIYDFMEVMPTNGSFIAISSSSAIDLESDTIYQLRVRVIRNPPSPYFTEYFWDWSFASPEIETASILLGGTVGATYTQTTLAVTYDGHSTPMEWSLVDGALPPGLTFDPDTGTISGTPTTAGTFNFTIRFGNAAAFHEREFSITIASASGGGGGGGGTTPPPPERELHRAYMFGNEYGQFRPNANLTRAEAATILARTKLLDFASETDTLPPGMTNFTAFDDVRPGDWFYYYVAWAYDADLVQGFDGSFRPDEFVTREELAAMVARTGDVRPPNNTSFHDDESISSWARAYVYTVYRDGLMIGSDGNFRPGTNIIRAETATTINRLLGRIDSRAAWNAAEIENLQAVRDFPDVAEDEWYFPAVVAAANDHYLTRAGSGVIDWKRIAN